ncbi:MAG TPA: hypothetical protein VFD82_15295 [Planctomycetota bacterium]|nr:hypothetical protein [Planctomycetota bacterium]
MRPVGVTGDERARELTQRVRVLLQRGNDGIGRRRHVPTAATRDDAIRCFGGQESQSGSGDSQAD